MSPREIWFDATGLKPISATNGCCFGKIEGRKTVTEGCGFQRWPFVQASGYMSS